MDFGKVIDRIKNILITPQTEWPVIAAEPATVKGLYTGYIAILAALPAIASFIKGSLIGHSLFGVTVRSPVGMGLVGMVLQYVLALVLVYVMALIINALAPTFGGKKDMVQALKTITYAWTASWIAGVAVILPWVGMLILIVGLVYAIYLFYLGLPSTMKCPANKAGGYTAVSIVITLVLGWIFAMIVGSVVGTAAISGAHISNGNGNAVTIDGNSALGKLAAMGQRAEQASKELEAAQKSGDTAAQHDAMGKMMGAVSGTNGTVEALAPDQIKGFLPDSLGDLKRTSVSAERNNAMGMQISQASADYRGDNNRHVSLEVSDTGGAKGFIAMAAAMAPEAEKQTEHGYEKTYTADGNLVHEAWDNQSRSGEYSVVVGKRFRVKATGGADSIDQLKQAVASIDLGKLESLRDAGVASD
jgi:hypothetical protein